MSSNKAKLDSLVYLVPIIINLDKKGKMNQKIIQEEKRAKKLMSLRCISGQV